MQKKDKPLIGINLLYIRPNHLGGTIRYAFELLKHLQQSSEFRLKIYIQQSVTLDDELRHIPKRTFRVRGGLLGRVALEHLWLPQVVKRDKVDLLFSPGFVSPLWGRFLKVVTIHDLYYKLFPHFTRPWQRRYWQVFIPKSMQQSHAVIAVSDSTRNDIARIFPNMARKITRIHLGGDGGQVSTEIADWRDDPFCLVIGNLTPNKNIECVVQAFALLKRQQAKMRLVVAGNDLFGRLQAALSACEQAGDVKLDVELLSGVTDEELAVLYGKACCLIQASHYEGFGLPVIEGMLRGCPVIASDIPVFREICENAALFFPKDDPQALVSCVNVLTQETNIRQQQIALGHQQAKKFQWCDTAKETALLFHRLLTRHV